MIGITGIGPLQSIFMDVHADVLIRYVSMLEKRRYVASITHFYLFFLILMDLSHALMRHEFFYISRDPSRTFGVHMANFSCIFTHVYSISTPHPPTRTQCHIVENQKDITSRNILLLTHYVICSHFCFALMHGWSHESPERCRQHVCATCCVCCGDGASWRWMRSAVWNSVDPLKWLLAATGERRSVLVTCGQLPHPHPQQNVHTASMLSYAAGKLQLGIFPLSPIKVWILHIIWNCIHTEDCSGHVDGPSWKGLLSTPRE